MPLRQGLSGEKLEAMMFGGKALVGTSVSSLVSKLQRMCCNVEHQMCCGRTLEILAGCAWPPYTRTHNWLHVHIIHSFAANHDRPSILDRRMHLQAALSSSSGTWHPHSHAARNMLGREPCCFGVDVGTLFDVQIKPTRDLLPRSSFQRWWRTSSTSRRWD